MKLPPEAGQNKGAILYKFLPPSNSYFFFSNKKMNLTIIQDSQNQRFQTDNFSPIIDTFVSEGG